MVDDTDTLIVPTYELGSNGTNTLESSLKGVLEAVITVYESGSSTNTTELEAAFQTVTTGITTYETGHTTTTTDLQEAQHIVLSNITSYEGSSELDWDIWLLDEDDTAVVLVGNWDTLDFDHSPSRLSIQGIPQYGVNEIETTFTAVFFEAIDPL